MTVVFITGTPCTGKTTLASKLKGRLVKVNDLAVKHGFIVGVDEEKGYKIIDIDKLSQYIYEMVSDCDELIIIEGHITHLCKGADKVIILRVHPEILKTRLEKRNYSLAKIQENLEAEALGVCSIEAYQNYPNQTYEINITHLNINQSVQLIENIIENNPEYPVGNTDFTDWLIKH